MSEEKKKAPPFPQGEGGPALRSSASEGGGEVCGAKNGKCTHCVERKGIVGPYDSRLSSVVSSAIVVLCVLAFFAHDEVANPKIALFVPVVGGSFLLLIYGAMVFFPNIIGTYLYSFTDNAGEYHCHRTLPPLEGFVVHGEARKAVRLIARIRNGGWFKRSAFLVYGEKESTQFVLCLHPSWTIGSWNSKKDLCLVDHHGSIVQDNRDTPLIGEFLFLRITDFSSVGGIVANFLRVQNDLKDARERSDHWCRESGRLDGMSSRYCKERNELLVFLFDLLALIEQNRETKGKSKHAQEIRERIEKMILEKGPSILKDLSEDVLLKPLATRLKVILEPLLEARDTSEILQRRLEESRKGAVHGTLSTLPVAAVPDAPQG